MKKWIIGFLVLLILLIAAVYVFIPANARISASVSINASHSAAVRVLADDTEWRKWWPGKDDGNTLQFENRKYLLARKMYQSFLVDINLDEAQHESLLVLLPLKRDSFRVEWKSSIPTGSSPVNRYRRYKKAEDLRNDLTQLLNAFRRYVENPKNVYGYKITETAVKDSVILVSSGSTRSYPSINFIYNQVTALKAFAAEHGVTETNSPMLNIDSGKTGYLVRVGLPINKETEIRGTPFDIKRMVLGSILIAEVKGGPYNIAEAERALELYMADYKRRSPAIPYESMVTDRANESDTSKWVTKIYYPVY